MREVLLFCALAAFPKAAAAEARHEKVFLIGLDGGTWTVLDPMLREGKLPHLRRLIQEGSSGVLESLDPMVSPSLWTTIATGKKPKEHGIVDFGSGNERFTSRDRKVQAIWNILSRYGRTVLLCGYMVTWPAEAVKGVVVSDRVNDFAAQERIYPPNAGGLSEVGYYGLSPDSQDVVDEARAIWPPLSSPEREQISHGLAHDEQYARIAERLLRLWRPDFFAIHLWGVDMVQHNFWRQLNTADPRSRVIPKYYEYADELIGRLLPYAGGDAVVLVVSDHGARARTPTLYERLFKRVRDVQSGTHAKEGILIARGPGVRKGGKLPPASILDLAPTMLYLEGLPVARDMPGKVLEALLEPDLLKTRPIREVPTHEAPKSLPQAKVRASFTKSEEALLRSLGYLK